MKKVFFTLALLVFTLASYAQVSEPSDNVISVENFDVKQGKSATFDVVLENPTSTDLTVFQIYFNVPEGFVLSAPTTTDRTPGFVIGCKNTAGSATRFMVTGYHDPNQIIPGSNGALLGLTLTAPGDAVVGQDYEITWDNAMVSDMNNRELEVPDGSFTATIVADKLDLWDTATEAPAATTGVENVNLHRSFTADSWNTLVVPFNMDADQIEEAFGAGTIVGVFEDWDYDEEAVAITLSFATVDEIQANVPVLIKPTVGATQEEGVMISNVAPFTPGTPDDLEYQSAVNHGTKKQPIYSYMIGTYVPVTIVPDIEAEERQLYLKNNRFYYFAEEGNTFKPYRAYLNVYDVLPMALNAEVKMVFDEQLTAINGIDVDRTNGKVYTVDGKYVGKDVNFNRMQKGVYIVNGKKVIK